MAGRIPQQTIDEILGRVDIVDVIDARVPLRKAGRDFQARCPFHEEKTPSFTVSQTKQFYHCFGCGAHGTAIGFLMEYEHLEFVEAVRELAKQAGVSLEFQETASPARDDGDLYDIMQSAANFYRRQLRDHSDAPRAIEYIKGRGLTGEIAAEFAIGFAPPGWDSLTRALGGDAKRRQQLITTGMAIQKEGGGSYDRFRDRIMFPIRDRRGRVIGFGGRVLGDDTPKYLNSPETPLFHKGRELYGLFEARQALRHIERLVVTEGYMDVVALAQHGIRNAVATLGTAVTPDHLNLLYRTTSDIVFCLDGDRAGREAAWKALDIVLPVISEGRQARFMFLPDGDDPDSLVRREGAEGFEARTSQSLPLSRFLFDTLMKEVDMTAVDGRARLVELARPKLAKVSNSIYRLMLIRELAERVRLDPAALQRQLDGQNIDISTPQKGRPQANRQRWERPKLSPIRHAILLLLNQPQLAQEVGNPRQLEQLQEPGIAILVELLELLHTHPNLSCGAILEYWRDRPEGRHLAKLARDSLTTPDEGLREEFLGTLRLLDKQRVEQEIEALMRKDRSEGLTTEEKQRFAQLLSEKRDLAQQPSRN